MIILSRPRRKLIEFGLLRNLFVQRNECFIGGLGEEDEFEVNIDIPPLEAFRKASLVSTMVWVLFSDGVPLALNFPVDAIGNIMFYFA